MGDQGSGRVMRSRAEWQEIVERFAQSGLSQAAFCRREGLAKGSLSHWTRQLGKTDARPGAFVELAMQPGNVEEALRPGEVELAMPGGVRLRWRL